MNVVTKILAHLLHIIYVIYTLFDTTAGSVVSAIMSIVSGMLIGYNFGVYGIIIGATIGAVMWFVIECVNRKNDGRPLREIFGIIHVMIDVFMPCQIMYHTIVFNRLFSF